MSLEVTILDETTYLDRSDPLRPVEKVLITFQTPDGRVDSLSLPTAGLTREGRNRALKEHIAKRTPRVFERVRV